MNKNSFELSDFSVDICDSGDELRIRVDCFADNGVHPPFNVFEKRLVSKTFAINEVVLYRKLSMTITTMLNDIVNSDIQIPDPCECQSREWFYEHPYDRQEYWRAQNGRVYPKDHTVHCPKNPASQRNEND